MRYLRVILELYYNESDYKTLLENSSREIMSINRVKSIAVELFKIIDNLKFIDNNQTISM